MPAPVQRAKKNQQAQQQTLVVITGDGLIEDNSIIEQEIVPTPMKQVSQPLASTPHTPTRSRKQDLATVLAEDPESEQETSQPSPKKVKLEEEPTTVAQTSVSTRPTRAAAQKAAIAAAAAKSTEAEEMEQEEADEEEVQEEADSQATAAVT